ncbi:MAG: hypothetical protein JRG96_18860 [Deltaproteobacteria bacterium]|nr:hypothetical protein [Deltaproteobacteria bacterium]MBW2420070.1 hypothetical protein [Deltaproteobacteria bacterium]
MSTERSTPGSSRSILIGMVVLGTVMAPTGWIVSDALERNNDFCTACHHADGTPLHIQIRRDFDGRPVHSLAGLHAGARVPERALRPATRCIDCHGGVGLVGRARIKALAARDALVWLTGDFEEPTEMKHPLGDADCRQCHLRFEETLPDFGAEPFHSLAVHNVELGVDCVECHRAHETGGAAEIYHLQPDHVQAQCARCHSEFQGGES